MTTTTMVITMAMTVSMYGVLRFHFGGIADLRCHAGITSGCARVFGRRGMLAPRQHQRVNHALGALQTCQDRPADR
jgi:hypothetical protein